ncbi:MAG: hypothetical protein MJ016_01110 [Victivallaceae bacterium]|nr:hypothetical protein [Victivallaceae bacterium]
MTQDTQSKGIDVKVEEHGVKVENFPAPDQETSNHIWDFLTGAAVLLIGVLIGEKIATGKKE